MSSAMVRGSRRSWASTRTAMANVTRALMPRLHQVQERVLDVARPVCSSSAAGVAWVSMRPSRIRTSSSQRSASSITWLETSSARPRSASSWNVPQRSRRSTGSRPTVGSSRTSSSGLPTSAVASDTRARWPPESARTSWSRCAGEPDDVDDLGLATAGASSTLAKNRRFSATVRSPYTAGAWVT